MIAVRALALALLLGSAGHALADPPAPARLQFKQAGADEDSLLLRALGAFAFACLTAGGIAYGIKRYGSAGAGGRKSFALQRVEALRLTPKSSLFVIRYRGEELLIAEGEHGVRLLVGKTELTGQLHTGAKHA